jgi:hypothetical protein
VSLFRSEQKSTYTFRKRKFVWTQLRTPQSILSRSKPKEESVGTFTTSYIENCACAPSGQLSKTMPLRDKGLYISGSEVSLSFGFGSRQEECVWCTSFFTVTFTADQYNRQVVLPRVSELLKENLLKNQGASVFLAPCSTPL